jgi:tagatose-1,6-bisphosphate aldolase non-catalytic subunit AgaZ/GatZ
MSEVAHPNVLEVLRRIEHRLQNVDSPAQLAKQVQKDLSVTVQYGHLTMTRKKIVDVSVEQLAQSVKMNCHGLKHPREDQRGRRQPEG